VLQYEGCHDADELMQVVVDAIDHGDKTRAIGGMCQMGSAKIGNSRQAEFLQSIAKQKGHDLAYRLCGVHLSRRTPLSADNNFICQAAWMLAGGVSGVDTNLEFVTAGECHELILQAAEDWKTPHKIPEWCCDGVHCAGNDPRFAGHLPLMYSCCRAYQHYGRLDPSDKWLPDFACYAGLQYEKY
jgi:hypothetical protein